MKRIKAIIRKVALWVANKCDTRKKRPRKKRQGQGGTMMDVAFTSQFARNAEHLAENKKRNMKLKGASGEEKFFQEVIAMDSRKLDDFSPKQIHKALTGKELV